MVPIGASELKLGDQIQRSAPAVRMLMSSQELNSLWLMRICKEERSNRMLQGRKVTHKVVADCVEALIGVHYVAGGELAASQFMRRLGLLPCMPPNACQLAETDRSAESPLSQ